MEEQNIIKKLRSLGMRVKALLFKNTSTRQTVAKNTFWLAVSNFGGRFLRAAIIIYSARVLGASEWGVFSYAISLIAFVTVFTDIGISQLLVRETAKSRDSAVAQKEILSTSFFLKLALLALGILAVIFVAPKFTTIEGVRTILPIVIFIFIFDTFRDFGFYLIRAIEKMEWEAALYMITNAAIVVFGFIFLKLSPNVASFTFSYALGAGAGLVATLFAIRKYISGIFSHYSFARAKYILASAWPIAISSVLGVLMINTDILIIGWLRSSEDVGLYSAAQRIIQLLYLFPAILAISLLPTFARLAGKDDKKMSFAAERVLSFVYLLALPMALGCLILGPGIINFVFGPGYAKAISSFQVLGITMLVDFPAVILSGLVFSYNKQKKLMTYSAIGGISNVIFDLILIPRFGIVGSAFATLSAQTLSNVYLHRTARRLNNFRVLPHLKKIFAASAVMAVAVALISLTNLHVLIAVAAGTAVYFGTLFALREPIFKEVRFILQPSASVAQETGEKSFQ